MGYNPALGRWIQRDPAQDGPNLYENVKSNPVNLTDALGLYVTASLADNKIVLTVGIVLWSSNDAYFDERLNIQAAIQAGLASLQQANPYKVCHIQSGRVYPLTWQANIQQAPEKRKWKNDDFHHVEVRPNGLFFGIAGPQNSFSPSINPNNNRKGWGAWTNEMGAWGTSTEYNQWWAAHEIMHFAGLDDAYSWLTGEPNAKYVGTNNSGQPILTNIMAGNGGTVTNVRSYALDQEQIERILTTRLKEALGWTYKVDYTIIK